MSECLPDKQAGLPAETKWRRDWMIENISTALNLSQINWKS
jgi:hypothetical protein